MSRFVSTPLPLSGLHLIERQRLGDSRGFLSRLFCAGELREAGWRGQVEQLNHTFTSQRGTLRGMHFQYPPYGEVKLVSCLRGEIWDVAVDLRKGSATFLQWHAEILSEHNNRAMLIPSGFAHGFQALSDNVEMLYCHSACYNPSAEDGLNSQDEALGIPWPLDITDISQRDQNFSMLDAGFEGVVI